MICFASDRPDHNCICFALHSTLDLGELGHSCKLSCELSARVKPTLSDVKVALIDMGMYYSYHSPKCRELDIIPRSEISVPILATESTCSLLKSQRLIYFSIEEL